MMLLALIVVIAIALFYLILQLDIAGLWKFILVFIEMILVSQVLIRRYKLPTELGLVLLKSKKGIQTIEELAKNRKAFIFLSDMGNVIAYGLLSLVITRRHVSPAKLVLGMLMLGFITVFVAPTALTFLANLLTLGTFDEKVTSASEGSGLLSAWMLLGILLIGGLFLTVLVGIVFYGGLVLTRIAGWLIYGSQEIAQTDPGAHFLIPGVNLPLFEGLIALIIVMVMHEGAHAILSRIGKIKLLSSGIVLFGIIPVGAFVEPDEEKLQKAEDMVQTRVLVAGCTSNLITSCVFFLLFFMLAVGMGYYGLTQEPALVFLKTTLGLTFALNFVVGVVNLLPLPVFDGYRLVEVNVKNKHLVKALMYVTLISFVLNFLPWFFRP